MNPLECVLCDTNVLTCVQRFRPAQARDLSSEDFCFCRSKRCPRQKSNSFCTLLRFQSAQARDLEPGLLGASVATGEGQTQCAGSVPGDMDGEEVNTNYGHLEGDLGTNSMHLESGKGGSTLPTDFDPALKPTIG